MEKRSPLGRLKFLSTFIALERDLIVGGQAVVEGVMMRTPSAYAIACRKSDGEIVTMAESLPKWSDKYKWLAWPVLRGGATLIQSLGLGIKALNFSAKIYEDDLEAQKERAKETVLSVEPALVEGTTDENFLKAPVKVVIPEETAKKKEKKSGGLGPALSIVMALGFNILLFIVAPLLVTNIAFIAAGWAEVENQYQRRADLASSPTRGRSSRIRGLRSTSPTASSGCSFSS